MEKVPKEGEDIYNCPAEPEEENLTVPEHRYNRIKSGKDEQDAAYFGGISL